MSEDLNIMQARVRFWLAGLVWVVAGAAAAQSAPTSLSFDQAVQMAVAASHHRVASEKDLEAQTERRREALADLGPKARVSFDDVRFDKAVTASLGADTFMLRPDKSRTASIAVTQPLTQLYGAYEKAGYEKTRENLAGVNVEMAKIDAAFTAGEAYRHAQRTDELLKIAQASINATASQVHDAESMERSGRLIQSELLKIRIANLEARAQLAQAQAARDKAYQALRLTLGLADGAELKLDAFPVAQTVQRYAAADYAASVKNSEGKRLEMRQAALGVEQSEYGSKLAHARFLPSVDLFLKYEREYDEPAFGQPQYTRAYGVQATWDIWDNGSRIFAEREAVAARQKAQVAVDETKDRLRLEIYGLMADLKAAKEGVSVAVANVSQAEEAYRLDQARFRSGLVTATDLVLSETAQTKARGALVSAIGDADVLILRLGRALGEGTPQEKR